MRLAQSWASSTTSCPLNFLDWIMQTSGRSWRSISPRLCNFNLRLLSSCETAVPSPSPVVLDCTQGTYSYFSSPPHPRSLSLSLLSLSLSTSYLFIVISKYFQWFCFSCMFITINSGSIIFYLFVFCLSCLNINGVFKKLFFSFLFSLSPFFTYSVV